MFRPFIEKNFTQWKPWTATCVRSSLEDFFIPQSDTVSGYAGAEYRQAFFKYCRVSNYAEPVRVWWRNDEFLKLEAEFPDIYLPWPDGFNTDDDVTKMDYSFGNAVFSQAELVYAHKGIALFLNSDYDKVIKVTVFLPCDMEFYISGIRVSTGVREF
ncbi:MAG TPA: hypothetical protein VD996_15640 [Chitinophagaceae bacterium]|nr:hypothetical protein [Chitinophagaceae bacterium]